MTPERREIEIMRICQYSWYRSSEIAHLLDEKPTAIYYSVRDLCAAGVMTKDKRTHISPMRIPITRVFYRTKPQ